ncbi:MAG: hypothetical protein JXQ26_10130 [Tissierellales bacterium]|nr:hypothetical protein [Tissierellales bacterium]MBN2828341.1 hypothetical protein [Tissierellales bacterium]
MKRYEENIYNFLVGTDFSNRDHLRESISQLSHKLLFDKEYLKEKIQTSEGIDIFQGMSERVASRAHAYYIAKGYEGINTNMFKLMVARLVQTVSYQILEGDTDKELLDDLIRSDVNKMWHYVKKEPTLACFFEGY